MILPPANHNIHVYMYPPTCRKRFYLAQEEELKSQSDQNSDWVAINLNCVGRNSKMLLLAIYVSGYFI